MPVFSAHPEHGNFLYNIYKAQKSGYALGNHSCNGSARRSHMKYNNEHQIEYNIEQS